MINPEFEREPKIKNDTRETDSVKAAQGEISETTRTRFLDFIEARVEPSPDGEKATEEHPRKARHPVSGDLIQLLSVNSISYSLIEDSPDEVPEGEGRGGTISFNIHPGKSPQRSDDLEVSLLVLGVRRDGTAFVEIGDEMSTYDINDGDMLERHLDNIEAAEQVGAISPKPVDTV